MEGQSEGPQLLRLAGITDSDEVEVVEDGDHGVDGRNDHNGEITCLECGHKKEELAGKTAGRWNPRQGEGGHGQGQGQQRRSSGKAAQVVDRDILPSSRKQHHHIEQGEIHEEINGNDAWALGSYGSPRLPQAF